MPTAFAGMEGVYRCNEASAKKFYTCTLPRKNWMFTFFGLVRVYYYQAEA